MELRLYQKDKLALKTHIDAFQVIDEGEITVGVRVENKSKDLLSKNMQLDKKILKKGYYTYYIAIDPFICSNPNCHWQGINLNLNQIDLTFDQIRYVKSHGCPKCKCQEMGVIKVHLDKICSMNEEFLAVPDFFDKVEVYEDGNLIYRYFPIYTGLIENSKCSFCGSISDCFKISEYLICQTCWNKNIDFKLNNEIIYKESSGFKIDIF